ncbi:MAG TPA: HepT-like ribonuclease domain-containing protein [Pseudonocardiaceae bacterium]|nr:HepT-like ribonuclease domain-containing protein [Pseudonocardiaceae bacterium]
MRSDEERLLDIIDESVLVLKYVPASREEFDADEVVQAALTRWLQNIGEAASQLSLELRSQHQKVLWQNIIGMRHRVVHDYFYIDLSVVWRACTTDVPALIPQVEAILRELREA